MTWRDAFGPEFDVPAEVESAVASGAIIDVSYKNDVCPSFSLDDGAMVRLWVEHPDVAQRETGETDGRFMVVGAWDVECRYIGDDIGAAIRALRGDE